MWGASPACRPAIDRSNFSFLGLLGECALVWVRRAQGVALHVCDAIRNAVTIGHWQLLAAFHTFAQFRAGSVQVSIIFTTNTHFRDGRMRITFHTTRRSLTHVRTWSRKIFPQFVVLLLTPFLPGRRCGGFSHCLTLQDLRICLFLLD